MAQTSRPPSPCLPELQSICSKPILAPVPVENRDSELKSFMIMAAIVSICSVCVIITAVYYDYLHRYSNTHRGISRSRPFSHRAADIFFPTSAREGLDKDIVNGKEMVNSRSASASTVQGQGVDNGDEGVKKEEQAGVAIGID
ncbi:hypothetical protein SUGI_0786430 [Cryptomeria japonica]|nr:hypothetical protein SUGI_0786430 [Cryptomeria japonica]